MKNLQTSMQVEESWVDGTAEKLSAMPTATSALELDVSMLPSLFPLLTNIQYIPPNMRVSKKLVINAMLNSYHYSTTNKHHTFEPFKYFHRKENLLFIFFRLFYLIII